MVLLYGGLYGSEAFGTGTAAAYPTDGGAFGGNSSSLPFYNPPPTQYSGAVGGTLGPFTADMNKPQAPVLPIYQQPQQSYSPAPQISTQTFTSAPIPMDFPAVPQQTAAPAPAAPAAFANPNPLAPLPQASNGGVAGAPAYANPTLTGGISNVPYDLQRANAQLSGMPSAPGQGGAPIISNGGGGNLPGGMGAAPPQGFGAPAGLMNGQALASNPPNPAFGHPRAANGAPGNAADHVPGVAGPQSRGQAMTNKYPRQSLLPPPPPIVPGIPAIPTDPIQAAVQAVTLAAQNNPNSPGAQGIMAMVKNDYAQAHELQESLQSWRNLELKDIEKDAWTAARPHLAAIAQFTEPQPGLGGKSRLDYAQDQIDRAQRFTDAAINIRDNGPGEDGQKLIKQYAEEERSLAKAHGEIAAQHHLFPSAKNQAYKDVAEVAGLRNVRAYAALVKQLEITAQKESAADLTANALAVNAGYHAALDSYQKELTHQNEVKATRMKVFEEMAKAKTEAQKELFGVQKTAAYNEATLTLQGAIQAAAQQAHQDTLAQQQIDNALKAARLQLDTAKAEADIQAKQRALLVGAISKIAAAKGDPEAKAKAIEEAERIAGGK